MSLREKKITEQIFCLEEERLERNVAEYVETSSHRFYTTILFIRTFYFSISQLSLEKRNVNQETVSHFWHDFDATQDKILTDFVQPIN